MCQEARCGQRALPVIVICLILFCIEPGRADEILPIETILEHANSYAAHLVTFRGRIESFETDAPLPMKGCLRATRYLAVVTDESGSIQTLLCGKHIDESGVLRVGDHVVVRAVLEVKVDGLNLAVTATAARMERAIE